jgi:hypothetical protein
VVSMLGNKRTNNTLRFHKRNGVLVASIILTSLVLSSSMTPISFAQLDGLTDSNLRRPTTTQVVPSNHSALTSSNDFSTFEGVPSLSKSFPSTRHIDSPSEFSPSYTVTNVTVAFAMDILQTNPSSNRLNVFIANTSQAIVNGTVYK